MVSDLRGITVSSGIEPQTSHSVGFYVKRWLIGFALATAVIWSTAWYFLNTIRPHVVDPTIDRYVASAGSRYRFRTEGWAVTNYGKHGIAAIPNLSRVSGLKVALWGDSFVEAPHVADSVKMAQQVSQIWQDAHPPSLVGVGIGRGDRTIADYYYLLPYYEQITPFLCHVIVMGSLRDVCPDEKWFLTQPDYRYTSRQRQQPLPRLRAVLDRHHLEFLWHSLWSLVGEHANPLTGQPIRFAPGPVPAPSRSANWTWHDLADVETSAWDFVVMSLQGRTQTPVVFLYAPRVPYIAGGEIVMEHPAAEQAERFAAACQRHGVDFIDLSMQFANHFRQTGRFPIGFMNSQLGKGHYNAAGHRLIAEAVCSYVERHYSELSELNTPSRETRNDNAIHPD